MARERRPCYEFGPFRLDVAEHRLLRHGQPVPLTPKVFDVLRLLVQQSGHLVDKETLLQQVWADSFVEEGTLNRSVSVLRKTLGDSATGQRYIQTVPTRGYRFVAPVTDCSAADSASAVEPAAAAAKDIGSAHPARPRFVALRAAGILMVVSVTAAIVWMILGPSGVSRSDAGNVGPLHRQVTFAGNEGSPSLSPDGGRLAYVSTGRTERVLMVQELPEGRPLAVFAAPEIGHVRWSPDGSELVMWTRGSGRDGIYVMTLSGGTIRRIAPGEYTACWSPDGSTIAVATYQGGKIVFLNRLGQQERTVSLKGVDSSIWALDWSGDARRLAFVTNDHERRFTVWTIKPDGSDQKKVLTEEAEIPTARWAPRGDAIYFSRRLNQTFSFYRIPVQGGENRNGVAATLITGLEAESTFALSADGTRLAYARAPFHSNLWTLDAGRRGDDRTNVPRQLTTGTSLVERPSISPDGSSVVFNVGYEGRANLFVMPMTGGVQRQLTFLDSFNVEGVWSPDGKHIAFASTEGHTPRVWIVSAEGGTPRALGVGPLSDSFDLSWSPATRIYYQQPGNSNYYELDPRTLREELVIRSPLRWIFSAVHSPVRNEIAVFWNRPPLQGLWTVDKDRRERPVYRTASQMVIPIGWSPDGHSIYFIEGRSATYRGLTAALGDTVTDARIRIVSANGGKAETVATLPFEEIGGVAMSPRDRKFVVTVYSSRSDVWVVDNFDGSISAVRAAR